MLHLGVDSTNNNVFDIWLVAILRRGRLWADIKYHDEVDAANVALRWMAGLPTVLALAAASAPPAAPE